MTPSGNYKLVPCNLIKIFSFAQMNLNHKTTAVKLERHSITDSYISIDELDEDDRYECS